MAAPTVRKLQTLISEQNKALQPQYDLIDADISAAAEAGKAQEAGLKATAEQEYSNIEQRASDKGMFFSGFSPDEQAKYNATTYLPALANLQATIASARNSLLGKKAELGYGAFQAATQQRESDIDRRFTYTERVGSQKFQAQQDAKNRKFQANQAAQERQFTAQENARDRAASAAAASKAAASNDISGVVKSVGQYLKKRVGDDGKVSPNTFQEGRQIWVAAGGDPAAYAQSFYGYVNRTHEEDYF